MMTVSSLQQACIVAMCLLATFDFSSCQDDNTMAFNFRNTARNGRGRQRPRNNRNFGQGIPDIRTHLSNVDWRMYAPRPPMPEEVECHVEVQVTTRVGGRCIRLGGVDGPAVCQSGIHLDLFNSDCDQIMHARDALAAMEANLRGDYSTNSTSDPFADLPLQ
ncbi:hypothetical protein CHS0354_036051 [Potamilus streckersoni]|uniref:Uncharacterized protein n=1 Tax=Potamilus streckersoni TaxID=2493646 RepID=A0AAE0SIP6_9BIVA|nr:hypothetical protein CHS0354_036051 [Potamilus streckersoni]